MSIDASSIAPLGDPRRAPIIPGLTFLRSGKVRDIYEVDPDTLLIVASDRISAFDCILPNEIPYKGRVLTQLSRFWFDRFAGIVQNHLITTDVSEIPAELCEKLSEWSAPSAPSVSSAPDAASEIEARLEGRAMLVRRAEVIPFECVVRGYLAGSGWKDYAQSGTLCGHRLREGLVESSKLPEPIFTPATKAEQGHDINVTIGQMSEVVGSELTQELESISLRLYREAALYAETRGIIICDTKFEFGVRDGELILVDEILTPDSSRFWPLAAYAPGKSQPSFDKQYVRDYLEALDWNKQPPAPPLPPEVVEATSAKYLEAFYLITGHDLRSPR